jgi:hypothetical protein
MQKLFNKVVALPFFGQPNDIAVVVHSIKSVSSERSPQPKIQEVGCDHLVYFINKAGLDALAMAIANTNVHALTQARGQEAHPAPAPTPVPNPVVNKTQDNRRKKAEKPQLLAGFVVGVLAAVAIIGLLLWQKSQNKEPSNQDKTSQFLQRSSIHAWIFPQSGNCHWY